MASVHADFANLRDCHRLVESPLRERMLVLRHFCPEQSLAGLLASPPSRPEAADPVGGQARYHPLARPLRAGQASCGRAADALTTSGLLALLILGIRVDDSPFGWRLKRRRQRFLGDRWTRRLLACSRGFEGVCWLDHSLGQ